MEFEQEGKIQPAGTQFLSLVDSLIDLFKVPTVSNVEVIFICYKLDENGEKTVEGGMHVVEFHAIAIRGIGSEVKEELRKQSENLGHLVSLLVLWQDTSRPGKLGIQKFHPVVPGESAPKAGNYLPWEHGADAVTRLLAARNPAVLVRENGRLSGILTRFDMLKFIAGGE